MPVSSRHDEGAPFCSAILLTTIRLAAQTPEVTPPDSEPVPVPPAPGEEVVPIAPVPPPPGMELFPGKTGETPGMPKNIKLKRTGDKTPST